VKYSPASGSAGRGCTSKLAEDASPGFFQPPRARDRRDNLGSPTRQHRAGFLQAPCDRNGSARSRRPAHQIRRNDGAARACTSAGKYALQMSRTALVAEENVSWWSSPRPLRSTLGALLHFKTEFGECPPESTCAPAARGDFHQICLSADSPVRNASFRSYADTHSPQASRTISRKQSDQFRPRSD